VFNLKENKSRFLDRRGHCEFREVPTATRAIQVTFLRVSSSRPVIASRDGVSYQGTCDLDVKTGAPLVEADGSTSTVASRVVKGGGG
jgi:hypothetical protein